MFLLIITFTAKLAVVKPLYRVSHKGRDCKDDLKHLKYSDSRVQYSVLPYRDCKGKMKGGIG